MVVSGTSKFKARFEDIAAEGHFRQFQDWWVSSIGIGTYLGDPDDETDRAYSAAVSAAVMSGCNLIDTAINYRFQRSERNVGNALSSLIASNKVKREELIISTKGGFLSFDGAYPTNPRRDFEEKFVRAGVCRSEDLVAGCHCMTPDYLENQLARSLSNLQTDYVDIYFVHNPETQLNEISRQEFLKRMLAAFKMLERKVQEGKIRVYGTATWNGFRDSPDRRGYLSLEELIGLARVAGGEEHHFRALQVPYNLAMPEAFLRQNQHYGPSRVSLLESAQRYGLIVLASASILQGQLAGGLPPEIRRIFPYATSDAQCSIDFVRSTPGVTTALVGMSNTEHVVENLQVATWPPVAWDQLQQIFRS